MITRTEYFEGDLSQIVADIKSYEEADHVVRQIVADIERQMCLVVFERDPS